eukprot:g71351.t1
MPVPLCKRSTGPLPPLPNGEGKEVGQGETDEARGQTGESWTTDQEHQERGKEGNNRQAKKRPLQSEEAAGDEDGAAAREAKGRDKKRRGSGLGQDAGEAKKKRRTEEEEVGEESGEARGEEDAVMRSEEDGARDEDEREEEEGEEKGKEEEEEEKGSKEEEGEEGEKGKEEEEEKGKEEEEGDEEKGRTGRRKPARTSSGGSNQGKKGSKRGSKKGKGKGKRAKPTKRKNPTAQERELTRLSLVEPAPPPVQWLPWARENELSMEHRGSKLRLIGKRKVYGERGYRTIRAEEGKRRGDFFFELTMLEPQKNTKSLPFERQPHIRVGFCTDKAELEAPLGYDRFGYSYRDLLGTVFNQAKGRPYGQPFVAGDVIGCWIHLPAPQLPGDLLSSVATTPTVPPPLPKGKGKKTNKRGRQAKPPEAPPASTLNPEEALKLQKEAQLKIEQQERAGILPLEGSHITYFKNGVCLGKAFENVFAGTYYPAVALYMGAGAQFNFGPEFAFPLRPDGSGLLTEKPAPVQDNKANGSESTEQTPDQPGDNQEQLIVGPSSGRCLVYHYFSFLDFQPVNSPSMLFSMLLPLLVYSPNDFARLSMVLFCSLTL